MERERKVNPDCPNASNPYHECGEHCAQRAPGGPSKAPSPRGKGSPISVLNGLRKKEERGIVVEKRDVDPSCPNASNPYHRCGEYCAQRAPGGSSKAPSPRVQGSPRSVLNGLRKKEEQGIVVEKRDVDPSCPNASNPYHQCAEYCNPGAPMAPRPNENGRSRLTENGLSVENRTGTGENRKVDPRCVNASNPYHTCAEYCNQRMHETSQVERSSSGSSKGSVSSSQKKNKGGLKTVERRDVHPNCVNASNPYHKCADYCYQRMSETM